MDISRIRELEYRISHRHRDESWGEMVEVPQHHTAVEHDPERQWLGDGRLFKCTTCDEWAVVRKSNAEGRPIVDEEDD